MAKEWRKWGAWCLALNAPLSGWAVTCDSNVGSTTLPAGDSFLVAANRNCTVSVTATPSASSQTTSFQFNPGSVTQSSLKSGDDFLTVMDGSATTNNMSVKIKHDAVVRGDIRGSQGSNAITIHNGELDGRYDADAGNSSITVSGETGRLNAGVWTLLNTTGTTTYTVEEGARVAGGFHGGDGNDTLVVDSATFYGGFESGQGTDTITVQNGGFFHGNVRGTYGSANSAITVNLTGSEWVGDIIASDNSNTVNLHSGNWIGDTDGSSA